MSYEIIAHQILVNRFGAKVGRDAAPIIKELNDQIVSRVLLEGDTIRSKRQLNTILKDANQQIDKLLSSYSSEVREELSDFLAEEIDFNASTLKSPKLPPRKTIFKNVLDTPMNLNGQAVTLAQAEKNLIDSAKAKINGYISNGYYQGQPTREISSNIRQALSATRHNADAVARTAVNHLANETRKEIYKANDDLVQGYVIISTLDTRTSEICRGFDGRQVRFTDNYQPLPPFHYNCRTTTQPWFAGEAPPKEETYYQWLKRQPNDVQNEALGAKKAAEFRKGNLKGDDLKAAASKRMTQPLSLDKLKKKRRKIDDI